MRGYWPLQTDDTTGITDYLDDVSKYVVSRTLQEPHGSTPPCFEVSSSTRSRPSSPSPALTSSRPAA